MAYFRDMDHNILVAQCVITCEECHAGLTHTSLLYSGPCRSAGDRRLTGTVGEEWRENMSLEEKPWNCLLYGHSKYIFIWSHT